MNSLEPIFDQEDLDERVRVRLKLEFATTETEVHQADVAVGEPPPAREILARATNLVIDRAKLTNCFAELYPVVQDYVLNRCFDRRIDPDEVSVRSNLAHFGLQEGIASYLARELARITVKRGTIEFDNANFSLSETRRFSWRRNLPPLETKKTVFNFVATYNNFERDFAEFLDRANDVLRFAALGTTEQGGSATTFRVDYLKRTGAIGFYYPDWVVVQGTEEGEVNWIVETKGRVWEGTEEKGCRYAGLVQSSIHCNRCVHGDSCVLINPSFSRMRRR